jgi:flagellar biosynthesis/type III secretory pathway M-ring protein FliF/YscJ
MKEILTVVLCILLFIIIVLAILFHERVRNIRKVLKQAADAREARRQAKEDEYFKRTSTKNYKKDDTPKFKDDYFKSVDNQAETKDKKQETKKGSEQRRYEETTTRRTVETGDGVTIIDDRGNQKSDRKIFDDNEGEYVEFEEVKSEE